MTTTPTTPTTPAAFRDAARQAIQQAADRIHNAQEWRDEYYAIDGKTVMDDLLDALDAARSVAARTHAEPAREQGEPAADLEHVWYCQHKHLCKWQCYALHRGLAWGRILALGDPWREAHDRECGGRLIQATAARWAATPQAPPPAATGNCPDCGGTGGYSPGYVAGGEIVGPDACGTCSGTGDAATQDAPPADAILGRTDKPFHRPECQCEQCREWGEAHPATELTPEELADVERIEAEGLAFPKLPLKRVPAAPQPGPMEGRELPDEPGVWRRNGEWWMVGREVARRLLMDSALSVSMARAIDTLDRGGWSPAQSQPGPVEGRELPDGPREVPQWAIDEAYEIVTEHAWGWPENASDELTPDQEQHQIDLAMRLVEIAARHPAPPPDAARLEVIAGYVKQLDTARETYLKQFKELASLRDANATLTEERDEAKRQLACALGQDKPRESDWDNWLDREGARQLAEARKFKAWVHAFLDGKGVPHDPDAEGNARHGCRISGRMKWVFAELAEAKGELKLWKPMTPEEAEAALDAAESVPLDDTEIERIVERVTDPSYRPSEPEHVQLAAKVKQSQAQLTAAQAQVEALRGAAGELLEVADLRGDNVLPHPENDPKTWTRRMQDAWDGLSAALASPSAGVLTLQCQCGNVFSLKSVGRITSCPECTPPAASGGEQTQENDND